MNGTDTAVPKAHAPAAGMGLGMLVIVVLAVVFFPITLVVVVIVRSQELVPRLIQAVVRLWPKRGLR